MRRLLPLLLIVSLGLTACGSSSSSDFDDIKVGGTTKSPTVKVPKKYEVDKTASKVLKKGDGDTVKNGDIVTLNYIAVDGRTGKTFDDSFKSKTPLTTSLASGAILEGFVKGLKGKTVGSRVLVAMAPDDGFGQDNTTYGIKKDDTLVFLFDIKSIAPAEATGTAKDLPDTVPQLKYDKDKKPSKFVKTKSTPAKVTDEQAYVAIKGDGAKITKGQTLTVQYIGQVYPEGKVFNNSWEQSAATFQVGEGQLIACWDDKLVGQTLGSRVILVCPAKYAYKDQSNGDIKAGDTLIFAIDLLAAS